MNEEHYDKKLKSDDSSDTTNNKDRLDFVEIRTRRKRNDINSHEKNLNIEECLKVYLKNWKIYLIILVPVLLLILLIMMSNKEAEMYATYTNEISKVKKAFNWPSVTSWNILNISLQKQIFQPETANKPSVVVLVGMKQPVEMLYLRISNIITQFIKFNCSLFKPNVFIETDVYTGQLNKFVAEERKSGARCIYVANIDQIPPNFGPSLHGLADEENAPYRDMIFLFSLIVPDPGIQYKSEPASFYDKETEPFVVNILREKWEHEMGEERFEALINRLCVNVVGVVSHK